MLNSNHIDQLQHNLSSATDEIIQKVQVKSNSKID